MSVLERLLIKEVHMKSHLTLEDRGQIYQGLLEREPLRQIALSIGKHPSTVANEIKKYRRFKQVGTYGRAYNPCVNRKTCKRKGICSSKGCQKRHCTSTCQSCIQICEHFIQEHCPKLLKPPYVCEGCAIASRCTLEKATYSPNTAHQMAKQGWSESRSGLSFDEQQIKMIDQLVSPLLLKGQSPSHIHAHLKDQLMISLSTFYTLIHSGLLTARPLDCPRIVRFKPRKKASVLKIDRKCRENRNYLDYLNFLQTHPEMARVEMDTVIGIKGGKVLLTIILSEFDLFLAFIRDYNDAASVTQIFDYLKKTLGLELFCQLFSVILTDNGSEFSNPSLCEEQLSDEVFCKIFYCDPGMPQQKPKIENVHSLLRRILPKGTNFNDLIQLDIDLVVSHINAYSRKKLNNLSPSKLFSSIFGSKILSALNIQEIDPLDVNLTPSLLRK